MANPIEFKGNTYKNSIDQKEKGKKSALLRLTERLRQNPRRLRTGLFAIPLVTAPIAIPFHDSKPSAYITSSNETTSTTIPPTTIFEKITTTTSATRPEPTKRRVVIAQPASTTNSADIPPDYLDLYKKASSTCNGLRWSVLAAIGKIESDHGRNPASAKPNSAGASGTMQFIPDTWKTYGVDGDNDGHKDILNPKDAIPGAAKLLCAALGSPNTSDPTPGVSGTPSEHRAIWTYNHSARYVSGVIQQADKYESSAN